MILFFRPDVQIKRENSDSDFSPPRRIKQEPDSDASPPRNRIKNDSDCSPPRIRIKNEPDSDESPPRKNQKTTLDGKKAGLQDAKSLKDEMNIIKQKEKKMFEKVSLKFKLLALLYGLE